MPRTSSARALMLLCVALALSPSVLVAQDRDPDPEEYLLAIGLIRRGMHEDAARQLQSFLRRHPDHPRTAEAQYRLGTCELENGDPDAAIRSFEAALGGGDGVFTLRAECRYRLGVTLQARRQLDAAAKQLALVVDENGADHYLAPAALYGAGECLRDAGDDRTALQRFLAAAGAAGDSREFAFSGLYQAGFVQLRLGDHAGAEQTFATLCDRFPDHDALGEIRHLQGEAAYRGGRHSEAEQAWVDGVRRGGEFADDSTLGLAWCRVKADDGEAALQLFGQVVSESKDASLQAHAQLEIGRLLHQRGDHRRSEQVLRQLLAAEQLAPEIRSAALEIRGLALLDLGESEAAQQTFETAMGAAADRSAPRLQYNLGDAFAGRGEWQDALSAYQRAAETDDQELHGDALYAAALALHKLGRFADSADCAVRLLRQSPGHRLAALAAFAVAENLFAAERWAEALRAYDSLGAEHGMAHQAAFKAAWSAYLSGDPKAGAQRFQAIVEERGQPDDVREEALSMLALTSHEADDAQRALDAADLYRARFPEGRFLARTERIAGRVLKARGDLRAAAARLAAAARSESSADLSAELALEQADVLFRQGDFEVARTAYSALAERTDRAGARALEGLAWCAFELGDETECLRCIAAGSRHEAAPDVAASLLELRVTVHHRAERWPDAEAAANEFLRAFGDHPKSPEVRYALGVAQARSGRLEPALGTLAQLAADGSASREDLVYYELAWVCRKRGDESAARAAFQKVAEISEDEDLRGEARLHLGEALLEASELGAAREQLALCSGKYRGRALYRTGVAWLKDGRQDRAIEAFESAVALGSQEELWEEALFMAGEGRMNAQDPERAVAHLRTLCDRSPDHERAQRARLYLGECEVQVGAAAEAIGHLEQFLHDGGEDNPVAQARANLWLGRARALRDEHDAAEAAFVRTTRLSDGELAAEAQYRIGASRRARDDLNGAVDAFVKLTILYAHEEWVARGLLEVGACYEQLAEPQKAGKFYQELLERFPKSPQAEEAQAKIRGLSR